MSENEGFYTFLGKIDAFDGQYIGGVKGIKKLMEKLNIQKDPDFKVLEVGAATGFTSCYVAKEYGCRVTSTDISEELVEKGRHRAEKLMLSNMEFMVADAMDLDFPDGSFDAVYGIAITGLLPHKLRVLEEYVRVVKPGGVVGGLELFIRDEVTPNVEAAINLTMGKVVGTGTKVMRLDEWRRLFEEIGMGDVEVDASYEDVFESPRFGLNTVLTYFKLVYYLVVNSWFRSLFFEVMELRKSVTVTSGDVFSNIGYLIYTGRK
ncbi:class I SAM-dependent methyltransferase [Thermoproteota archaeon]